MGRVKEILIEDEYMEMASKAIQEELDWEIITDMMCQVGWVRVERNQVVDNLLERSSISQWITDHCKGRVQSRGRTWVFSDPEEALMFRLTWP
jgi:hypothetical protein